MSVDLQKKLANVQQEYSLKIQQEFSMKLNRVWQSTALKDKKLEEVISDQLDIRDTKKVAQQV